MRKLAGWVLIAGFVGCGGSGGGDEAAASSGDVEAMCQAMCEYDTRCRGGAATDCLSSCRSRIGEPSNLSQQALAIAASCYRDPACLDDDTCEERALTRDASIPGLVDQCIAFAATCPSHVDVSLCLRAGFTVSAVRDEVKRCTVGQCTTEKAAACFSF